MRSRAASALAVVFCACAAQDKVLTPDEESGGFDAAAMVDAGQGRDAALANDAAMNVMPTPDAGGSTDSGGGAVLIDAGAMATDGNVPSGNDAGPVVHAAKDPDCDLNGVWIARQNTASEALFIDQFANNWYYLEFAQDGEQVVVSRHMDCGITVLSPVVEVQLAPATMRALIQHNRQVGRKGSFAKQADGSCAFQMEKFWSIRGASEDLYAPKPRNSDSSVAQVRSENPLPPKGMPDPTGDWDGDGHPGIAWQVNVLAAGTRHSAQRDWTRWFSAPGYQVTAATNFTTDLVVRSDFDNEEIVYEVTDDTLNALSEPDGTVAHTLTLRFLGRTPDDPRAQAIIKADDFDTCLAIQDALKPVAGIK
jgi:hypothetical protein